MFYIVVPECGIGKKMSFEEAEKTAKEFVSEYGENALVFQAVALYKKRQEPVDVEYFDEQEN